MKSLNKFMTVPKPVGQKPQITLIFTSFLASFLVTACSSARETMFGQSDTGAEPCAGYSEPGLAEQDLQVSQVPIAPEGEASAETNLDTVGGGPGLDDGQTQATSAIEVVDSEEVRAPQLIKTAELQLQVEDTTIGIQTVTQIIRQQQGDVLQLQDNVPVNAAIPHQAYLQLRVPQNRLDITLEQLKTLGKVKNQNLTAQDVSNQLVDYEARLRNLRKAEETVLGIMDRSGEVGDVLQVAQELNNIRESIERINAQLQSLKTRVAFSTINLYLEESVAAVPLPDRTWVQELQQAWQGATRSVGNFTRGVLVLAIWLLVYSPYWLVLGGGSLLVYKFLCRGRKKRTEQDEN